VFWTVIMQQNTPSFTWFNVTSTGNAGCFKKSLTIVTMWQVLYSLTSWTMDSSYVFKFISFRNNHHTVTSGYYYKALFETLCILVTSMRSDGIDPRILNPGTRLKWSVSRFGRSTLRRNNWYPLDTMLSQPLEAVWTIQTRDKSVFPPRIEPRFLGPSSTSINVELSTCLPVTLLLGLHCGKVMKLVYSHLPNAA
jgi:hypothetical protein